jgi:hypothetical protein
MMTIADEARIRERAYLIWEAEGRPEGRAADHWTRALKEVNGSIGITTPTAKTAARSAAIPAPKAAPVTTEPVKTPAAKTTRVVELEEESPKIAAKKRTGKKPN